MTRADPINDAPETPRRQRWSGTTPLLRLRAAALRDALQRDDRATAAVILRETRRIHGGALALQLISGALATD